MKHKFSTTQTNAATVTGSVGSSTAIDDAADLLGAGGAVPGLTDITTNLAQSLELEVSKAIGSADDLFGAAAFPGLGDMGAGLARSLELEASEAVCGAANISGSAAVTRLSDIGADLARSFEVSKMIGGATDISGSAAVTRLSDIGADLARSFEVSKMIGGATDILGSAAVTRLGDIGADLAGSFEVSKMIGGATDILGSAAVTRLGDIGTDLAGSFEVSKMIGGATDILGSAAVTRLGDIGTDFAQLLEASKAIHTSATYMRAGFSPGLISFPHATYDKVLFGAEFQLSFSSIPIPQPIDLPDPDSAFNSRHWEIFVQLEQRLRQVVEERLQGLAGTSWIAERTPQSISNRWTDRQNKDRAEGRPVYPAIQYANFMELEEVISNRANWRQAFRPIFQDKRDIAASFHRLLPVRNALAHSRPLGRTDVLTLVAEAARIFRALRKTVLH